MGKLQGNDGFTLIEAMLTLFIVSILTLITVTSIPKFDSNHMHEEVRNIQYFLEKAQFQAMVNERIVLIRIDYKDNKIYKADYNSNNETLSLKFCKLQEGSLQQFSFNSKGDSNAFGTLYLNCEGKTSKFVFQIQKARFRIE